MCFYSSYMVPSLLFLVSIVFVLTPSLVRADSIPLVVKEPSGIERKAWPVTSGVPLPEGALRDPDRVRLISDGEELPLQTQLLSSWPDGSVKWLLLDFQVNLSPGSERKLALEYGPGIDRSPIEKPLSVQTNSGSITINTGTLKLRLSHSEFRLLDSVWLDLDGDGTFSDSERVTSSENSGIVLTDPEGNIFRADRSKAEVEVEQSGPLRACIRVEGTHAASEDEMFRYIVRIHAFRGQPYVRVFYTFVNDWPHSLMAQIKSLSLDVKLPVDSGQPVYHVMGIEEGKREWGSGAKSNVLFQIDDRSYQINGQEAGKRAPGWLDISTEEFGATAVVRDFWQNYPKALSAKDQTLSVGICPAFEQGLYDGKPLEETLFKGRANAY